MGNDVRNDLLSSGCMNIAAELGMPVPPHGLFPMSDGKLCYIVKRFDRLSDGRNLHKETMYQILEFVRRSEMHRDRQV